MAFGTELQGRTSHEALLAVQDAEIHLLETIKKSISQRIKCDRDYAVALSTIVTSAQKQDTVPNKLPTYTVWPTAFASAL
jgi:tyrosine-protein kinase Fer